MIYIILLTLMFFSAFFSSLETGLLALGEVRIRRWAEGKIESLDAWIKEPASIVTGILIGNNLVNITFSAVFTVIVIHFTRLRNIPESWTEMISIACSSLVILVLGEIIPKTIANTHPDKIVSIFYRPFMNFYIIFKALIRIFNKVSFSMIGVMKLKREKLVSRKEVQMALKDIESNGILEKESSQMLRKVLLLTQKTVGEVMIPRKKIRAIDMKWEYARIIENLLNCHYSRIPAYDKNMDNLKGVIYIKDVIRELNRSAEVDLNRILREPHITYPGRSCQHLFHELRKKRTHCAVIRSKNRVIGFVTMEDLIEEVVGEIYDEYDARYNTV